MGAGLLPLAQRSGTLHSVVQASWPSARGRGAARLSRALAVSSLRRSADGSVRLGHALGSVQGLRSGRTLGGGCSVAAALRAPTGATGFRPGVRETASAQVGLVLGLRAEWKAGMVNTGEREVTGSTPRSGSLLYF